MGSNGKRTRIKGLPPRLLLRERDYATGSYPTIGRTGDDRLGNYSVPFDDRHTIMFAEQEDPNGVIINGKFEYVDGYTPPKIDLTQTYKFLDASANLISHYRFEGNIADSSTSIFSGSITSPSLYSFSGNTPFPGSKKSIDFQGTDSQGSILTLTHSASYAFGDASVDKAFSVCAWVNMRSTTKFAIMTKLDSAPVFEWGFGTNSNKELVFNVFDNAANVYRGIKSAGRALDAYVGQWIHLAVTYDGRGGDGTSSDVTTAGMNLYFNGNILSSSTDNLGSYTAMHETPANIYIGHRVAAPQSFADGKIDEVAVYQKELNQNEVRAIMGYAKGLSMPSMLPANSPHLTEEMTSSFFISGTVRKGISDTFVKFTPGEDLTPFNESYRAEQSQGGAFFMTGSPPEQSAPGFSSRLASKTQLKYTFNIATETQMDPHSASMYYLNAVNGRWELAGGGSSANGPIINGQSPSREVRYFDALGNVISSGTLAFQSNPLELLSNVFSNTASLNAQVNEDFEATSSQIITMDNIQHPFLLEKMSIEIPISVGPGWTEDLTTWVRMFGDTLNDIGGPCVTFGLSRQEGPIMRELITSATFIPENDNQSIAYKSAGNLMPAGFLAYGTPTAVVSGSEFTGSVVLNAEATVTNGTLGAGETISEALASIYTFNPFGRRHGHPSGRSYFGKDYTFKKFSSFQDIPNGFGEDDVTTLAVVQQKTAYSPYLLLPGDKLCMSLSKYRPVLSNSQALPTTLTGSHDIFLTTGTMNVTLYGSLIRDNLEYHDTLNQPLSSLAVHETIHFDSPVVDQFDVEHRSTFLQSYVDQVVSGSMFADQNRHTRRVIGNAVGDRAHLGDTGSLLRGVRHATESGERFYDTLLPAPDKIATINGADVIRFSVQNYNTVQIGPGTGIGNATNMDNIWPRSYPFETKYSSLVRLGSPTRETFSTFEVDTFGGTTTAIDPTSLSVFCPVFLMMSGTGNSKTPIDKDATADVPNQNRAIVNLGFVNNSIGLKLFYGIGDHMIQATGGESAINMPELVSLESQTPNIAGDEEFYRYNDALIRGWKYGIKSAFPFVSSAVFRRDHYGQFRDMLEQRPDTKFFDGSALASPVFVKFTTTDGELSFSSNVSIEATSSLPYFDNESRNRGVLPDTEFVNEP